MKWLLILGLIVLLIAVVAWHFRKYIQSAWFIYMTYRKMRQRMNPAPEKQVAPKPDRAETELVRCPTCGKWISMSEAVKLKSNYFCSLACLEQSVAVDRGRSG